MSVVKNRYKAYNVPGQKRLCDCLSTAGDPATFFPDVDRTVATMSPSSSESLPTLSTSGQHLMSVETMKVSPMTEDTRVACHQ
jgi:hypothetical protein